MGDRHINIVFSEPFQAPYGDDEYNQIMSDAYHDWYNNVHMPEMLGVSGWVSCQRYELIPEGRFATTELPGRFCAIYEIEGDPGEAFTNMWPLAKAWSGKIPAAAQPQTWQWWTFRELGDKMTADGER